MDIATIFQNVLKILGKYWDVFLIEGLTNTLSLSAITVFFGAIFGALLALGKLSRFKVLRFCITAFVEIIRGTPILLQLYFGYFILPMLFPALGVVLTRLVTREGFQMCAWCTVLAIFLSYVTIRTGSTFAAAIGHGAVNGTTNGVTLFSLSGGNPFVGPLCTGIVGGLPLLAVAAIMLWDMRRREKAGTLRMPEAGLPDGVRRTRR